MSREREETGWTRLNSWICRVENKMRIATAMVVSTTAHTHFYILREFRHSLKVLSFKGHYSRYNLSSIV